MKTWRKFEKLMIILMLMPSCRGGKVSAGRCPSTASESGSFINRMYPQTYRVYARSPESPLHGLDCITFSFVAIAGVSPNEFSLTVTGRNKRSGTTQTISGSANAYGINVLNSGTTSRTVLSITISNSYFPKTVNYQVLRLSTTVAVLYSCQNLLFGKKESALILNLPGASTTNINVGLNQLKATGYPEHGLIYSYMDC